MKSFLIGKQNKMSAKKADTDVRSTKNNNKRG